MKLIGNGYGTYLVENNVDASSKKFQCEELGGDVAVDGAADGDCTVVHTVQVTGTCQRYLGDKKYSAKFRDGCMIDRTWTEME